MLLKHVQSELIPVPRWVDNRDKIKTRNSNFKRGLNYQLYYYLNICLWFFQLHLPLTGIWNITRCALGLAVFQYQSACNWFILYNVRYTKTIGKLVKYKVETKVCKLKCSIVVHLLPGHRENTFLTLAVNATILVVNRDQIHKTRIFFLRPHSRVNDCVRILLGLEVYTNTLFTLQIDNFKTVNKVKTYTLHYDYR